MVTLITTAGLRSEGNVRRGILASALAYAVWTAGTAGLFPGLPEGWFWGLCRLHQGPRVRLVGGRLVLHRHPLPGPRRRPPLDRVDGESAPFHARRGRGGRAERRLDPGGRDVSERIRLQENLAESARTDTLTGLLNRGAFLLEADARPAGGRGAA